jgi:hypothetical protein
VTATLFRGYRCLAPEGHDSWTRDGGNFSGIWAKGPSGITVTIFSQRLRYPDVTCCAAWAMRSDLD